MKKTGGLMMYLLSIFMLLSICSTAAQAFDVSGTVSTAYTKPVYLSVYTQSGRVGTSIATSDLGAFTIRGVPSGSNFIITAFEDTLETGSRHASDPSGFSTPFNVSANVSGITVALTPPAAITTVPAPSGLTVLPSDNSALVMWNSNNIGQGELADKYGLFWSTSSDVIGTYTTQGGSLVNIPATGDMRGLILSNATVVSSGIGLTNGAILYFAVTAKIGANESLPATLASPVTINPASGANTVSGAVTFPAVTLGKPLMVALVDSSQIGGPPSQIYMTKVTSPVSPQNYSIPGVPTGSYRVFAFFDLNGNSLVDAGDLNVSDSAAPVITVAGTVSNADVTLTAIESAASVRTNHWKNSSTESYGLNYEIEGKYKRPVKVTLMSGPNTTGPIDIALDDYGRFNSWTGFGATVPAVGDTYTFDVTYADATIGTITGSVTGVLSSFATPVSPVGAVTFNAAPVFSWTAPATPPASYGYQMSLNQQNGGLYWDPKELPGTQTTAIFNFDGMASQALTDNTAYNWAITVFDASGNSATQQTSFSYGTPAGNPINITTTMLPPATVGNPYTQQFYANGGSGSVVWTVSSGTLPTGLTLTSAGSLSGTPTVSGPSNFTIMATDSTIPTNFTTMPYSFMVNTSGAVTSMAFTGAVQDCTATTCVNLQGVTITTVGLSPELTTTSDAGGLFSLVVPVTTTLNSLPATAPFHLVMSAASLVNSASSQIQLTTPTDSSNRPYSLYPALKLAAWGVSPGMGVINSRIVDAANLVTGYITGAVVTATTSLGQALPVEYFDTAGVVVAGGSTTSNGRYIVRNIPAGTLVTVSASAPGYSSFQTRSFHIYADTVSQGRIAGIATVAGDTQAPSVPTGLNAQTINSSQINLNWNISTDNVGVFKYQVFRNGVLAGQPAGATNTSWSDNSLAPSTTYSYTVSACDAANNCSAPSAPVSATTLASVPVGPVNITGTITYTGSKTGRVFVSIPTNNGTLGTSVAWPAGTTSVPYTIQGVPSNNTGNSISAFMDILDNGIHSASSPAGSSAGGTTATLRDLALNDPTPVAPAAPALVEVKPGPASVFIMWQPNKVNGVVDADYFDVYWSTSALVSSTNATGSKLGVSAGMDSPLVINSLTDGTSYYFVVVPRAGALTGAASTAVGPITAGAATGLNTVSGTVTYSGAIPGNTTLYVAVVPSGSDKGMGNLFFTSILNPSASQTFSVSGIPDGGYQVYVILDMNNDGLFASGDISNTNSEQAPMIVLAGNAGASGLTIPLVNKNSEVVITTDHRKNGTISESYSVNGSVMGQLKRPVAVTLTAVPASSSISVPMDMGFGSDNGKELQFWSGNSTRPTVGDTYTFTIKYSDGTEDAGVTATVTGVSDSFPVSPSISTPVSTIPLFSWSAPTTAPVGNYQYSLWVGSNNSNNNNRMWEAWNIPANQLSIVYGSGDPSNTPLVIGTQYGWNIGVRDQKGNRATVEGLTLTPTVAAASDKIAPVIVSTVPANNATGVSINAPISVTFSEAVTGMPSLTAALKNNTTGLFVAGTGSESADKKTQTFTPGSPLTPGTTYSIQFATVTDLAGNPLPVTTLTFTTAAATPTDTTKPVTTASPAGGVFSSTQSVTLTANEAATIYYSIDGSVPTLVYSSPIQISSTTILKFFSKDDAGNSESVKSILYTIVPSGDINGDGKIDIIDAHRILEIAVGRIQATADDLKNADVAPLVNGLPAPDGIIGVGDVVVVLRRIVDSVKW